MHIARCTLQIGASGLPKGFSICNFSYPIVRRSGELCGTGSRGIGGDGTGGGQFARVGRRVGLIVGYALAVPLGYVLDVIFFPGQGHAVHAY